ncbi:MAG: Vancomycin B-type resistance protein VanW [bacterium ADurb.Bin429]|nr:MAG: Vancomycin B-type resistance protein VanW [bacterium ADurb.Bin429]
MRGCFGLRVMVHQLRRYAEWLLHPRPWAVGRGKLDEYPVLAVERSSPLQRAPDGAISSYCAEKTRNLRLACAKVDGLVIAPGEVFSFCRAVGPTTRQAGYLPALELRDGALGPAVGGGLCQLANLLFLLAVQVNAEIIERHRHSYDLFRDVGRTVPFGCGATVFYNYVDFQFRNTLPFPLLLRAAVEPPELHSALYAREPLPFTATIVETDHRFFRRDGDIYRANRLWRDVAWHDGHTTHELLFENECRVLYDAEDLVEEGA